MDAYYRDDLSEIYLHDSITGMAELPEGLTDLVVTSPPYNVEKNMNKTSNLAIISSSWPTSMPPVSALSRKVVMPL